MAEKKKSDSKLRSELDIKEKEVKEEKEKNKPKEKEYEIGGYTFRSEEDAQAAKDEINAIKYLTSSINSKDPKQVFKLYNQIIDRELFSTMVGYNYLKQLQSFLYTNDTISNDKIKPIPIKRDTEELFAKRKVRQEHRSELYALTVSSAKYKDRYYKSMIFAVTMAIAVVAMIIILMTGSNSTVIDYEVKLQDKYAEWQERLESQEASLKARENEFYNKMNK